MKNKLEPISELSELRDENERLRGAKELGITVETAAKALNVFAEAVRKSEKINPQGPPGIPPECPNCGHRTWFFKCAECGHDQAKDGGR